MMNSNNSNKTKFIILITGFMLVCFISYGVIMWISHIGKTKVSVITLPSKASIYINDKKTSSSVLYLSKGKYTISSKLDGFIDDKIDINIKDSMSRKIILLPEPSSDQAYEYLSSNKDIQIKREALGGEKSSIKSQESAKLYPILKSLPHTDIDKYFTIGYSFSLSEDNKTPKLIVTDSSPEGRSNALKWIESHGDKPSNYIIEFSDYRNPLFKLTSTTEANE